MRKQIAVVVPVVSGLKMFRTCVALCVSAGLILSCGCAGRHWNVVGWFPVKPAERAGEKLEVRNVAPASGVYKVKFATRVDADEDDFHTYGGARRVLHRGDHVGFARDESGKVYAIAGAETFPLPERKHPRRTPNFLVWAYHSPEPVKSGLAETLDGIGQALVVTAVVVGVASLVLLGIWYDLQHHDQYDACYE
jgi:hypothetical protein